MQETINHFNESLAVFKQSPQEVPKSTAEKLNSLKAYLSYNYNYADDLNSSGNLDSTATFIDSLMADSSQDSVFACIDSIELSSVKSICRQYAPDALAVAFDLEMLIVMCVAFFVKDKSKIDASQFGKFEEMLKAVQKASAS